MPFPQRIRNRQAIVVAVGRHSLLSLIGTHQPPRYRPNRPARPNASDAGGSLAGGPTRDTNSGSDRGSLNVPEQPLDSLRKYFTRKPSWLLRFIPFRACL
jgi:hypothetical protein